VIPAVLVAVLHTTLPSVLLVLLGADLMEMLQLLVYQTIILVMAALIVTLEEVAQVK